MIMPPSDSFALVRGDDLYSVFNSLIEQATGVALCAFYTVAHEEEAAGAVCDSLLQIHDTLHLLGEAANYCNREKIFKKVDPFKKVQGDDNNQTITGVKTKPEIGNLLNNLDNASERLAFIQAGLDQPVHKWDEKKVSGLSHSLRDIQTLITDSRKQLAKSEAREVQS